ncbi:hypothetical protein IQ264_23070 [Phormidium sp. LEGE 05292]|uniref:hypothetical protein n=1 Tax=[Phormidium] sp. LEGE 05292 TaxID=767427 RepID=UPI00187FA67B|nr:hypothetical protein [Phormidium sp. LEGE 05292]MBE9228309.1 hypothetical protein [Phormidium sp. LEGE 05292]
MSIRRAKAKIGPQLAGQLQPEKLAEIILDFLEHPKKLPEMSELLRVSQVNQVQPKS